PGQRAGREIIARCRASPRLPELVAEELGRGRVQLPQRLAAVALFGGSSHLAHLDADLRTDPLDRFHKVETESFLHEREHVALFAAHEARVPASGRHGEIVVLPLVKWTRATK